MKSSLNSDTDNEIQDTIRLHLFACYANREDGREFTREELEAAFATDAGLRAWVTDKAGINPDTLVAIHSPGREIINVCVNAWVAKGRGLSEDDTFKLIQAGLNKILD
jgi:hypothetical protein